MSLAFYSDPLSIQKCVIESVHLYNSLKFPLLFISSFQSIVLRKYSLQGVLQFGKARAVDVWSNAEPAPVMMKSMCVLQLWMKGSVCWRRPTWSVMHLASHVSLLPFLARGPVCWWKWDAEVPQSYCIGSYLSPQTCSMKMDALALGVYTFIIIVAC